MSAVSNFAKSGFWDYKNIIVPAAIAAPLAIEGAILAKNIYKNPSYPKEKLIHLKDRIVAAFTQQKGETDRQAVLRITKNIFLTLFCLALMAGAIYGSVILLPTSMAISVAISAVFAIGKLFANAEEYKKQVIEAFTAKEGEAPEEARKRIRNNVIKTIVLGALGITAVVLGAYYLAPLLSHFSWSVSLPYQTKGVVFMEYASIGVLHSGLAYSKWQKGEKGAALFHLFCGGLSIFFPFMYWNNDMRLHHSFYGLLAMAMPFRAMKIFGGLVTCDSALYFLEPLRGYANAVGNFVQYDFINSVVDNAPLLVGSYAGAMMLQSINDDLCTTKVDVKKVFKDGRRYGAGSCSNEIAGSRNSLPSSFKQGDRLYSGRTGCARTQWVAAS